MNSLTSGIGRLAGDAASSVTPLGGGDVSSVHLVTLKSGRVLVAKSGGPVEREAAMLRAIGASGALAPDVVAVNEDLLLMSHCAGTSGIGGAWATLAEQLVRLWSVKAPTFGWDEDYAFGPVALPNARNENWARFWAENRIACHLPHLPRDLGERVERFLSRIGEVLPASPTPSLLHGDLWGGNVMTDGDAVTGLIDPACYFGHREVDFAMLTMFDRPPESFIDSIALDSGWRERLPAYRLFPLLVHFRLFGGAYRAGIESELAQLPG